MSYIKIIEQAIIFFPIIAIIITFPFVLIQYHKYGSIPFFKTLVIYSFVLYLLCAYFLIILPLPSKESVAILTTPRTQLVPFMFIIDFIKSASFSVDIFKQNYFYMPLFNIVLTIPFGIYLRYLFKIDLKKCFLYSFFLSLFFELTQLSGLYFIYSRGYRLFDVDDLFLNTLGGVIGYFVGELILKPLPTIDRVNQSALKNGVKVSGFKRTVSFFLDFFIYLIMIILIDIISNSNYSTLIIAVIYYIIIPIINKGATIGQKFLNLKIVTHNSKHFIIKLFARVITFIISYIVIPLLLLRLLVYIGNIELSYLTKEILCFSLAIVMFVVYLVVGIKFIFTSKEMLYEKISMTKIISTVGEK